MFDYFCASVRHKMMLVTNDNFSHITGPWINSVKNIKYTNKTLCADARTNRLSDELIYNYTHTCLNVNNHSNFYAMNSNGELSGKYNYEPKVLYKNSEHRFNFPFGPWKIKANKIQYFPGAVCAQFVVRLDDEYKYEYKYEYVYREDCIEYSYGNILDQDNGKFFVVEGNISDIIKNYSKFDLNNDSYYNFEILVNLLYILLIPVIKFIIFVSNCIIFFTIQVPIFYGYCIIAAFEAFSIQLQSLAHTMISCIIILIASLVVYLL